MPSIVWKGHLTFGLVSIPVKLYRAARRERVRMHYVHREERAEPAPPLPLVNPVDFATGASEQRSPRVEALPPRAEPEQLPEPPAPISRVSQALVTSSEEQPIPRAEVLKGYEVEPERYVVFDREELKVLQRRTSPTMEIVRSVKLSEIDPVFFETSYYVVPDRGGEKPYAILFKALRETGHVALARGMYGREHVVIVRPGKYGLLAHTMFYVDEIRSESEFRTDVQSVGAKELELAKTFLEALEAPFAPEEFKDEYREQLEAMIAKKLEHAGAAPAREPAAAAKPVVDILEALKKSIAMARKPAALETQPARKAAGESHGDQGQAAVAQGSLTGSISFPNHGFKVGDDGVVLGPLGPFQGRRAESLISRCHVSACLDEPPNPIQIAAVGGLVQRPRRPLREFRRFLERLAAVHRFAMGNDDALEREVEHCAQVRDGAILVSWGRPDPQHSIPLGQRIPENQRAVFGNPKRRLVPAARVAEPEQATRQLVFRQDRFNFALGRPVIGIPDAGTECWASITPDHSVQAPCLSIAPGAAEMVRSEYRDSRGRLRGEPIPNLGCVVRR
jgi:DNA end-binding protein Ku